MERILIRETVKISKIGSHCLQKNKKINQELGQFEEALLKLVQERNESTTTVNDEVLKLDKRGDQYITTLQEILKNAKARGECCNLNEEQYTLQLQGKLLTINKNKQTIRLKE